MSAGVPSRGARPGARRWIGVPPALHVFNGDAPVPDIAAAIGVAAGAGVLAGRATRAPHDHWIGGVHLAPGHPRWVCDAGAATAIRVD